MNTPTTSIRDSVQPHAAQEPHQKRGNDKASEAIEQASGELVYVPLSKLVHSPFNARKSGGESVSELAALIKSQGLLLRCSVCCLFLTVLRGCRGAEDAVDNFSGARQSLWTVCPVLRDGL